MEELKIKIEALGYKPECTFNETRSGKKRDKRESWFQVTCTQTGKVLSKSFFNPLHAWEKALEFCINNPIKPR